MTELLPDLILGSVLLLTTAWCAIVHQRLRGLRTERGEMEAFIGALAVASERAEAAIAGLREAAGEADRRLREQGDQARQRGSELVRLIESGTRLARRLEADLDQGVRVAAGGGPERERPEPRSLRHDALDQALRERRPEPKGERPRQMANSAPPELLKALETLR